LATCLFCAISPDRVVLENEYALAFADGYPVAQGHTLGIPRQHVASVFDLGPVEQAAVWGLVAQVRAQLGGDLIPDGFTVPPDAGWRELIAR
jgi:diadenosine tetraphosphate (Ap4A) HIT family hydrolase